MQHCHSYLLLRLISASKPCPLVLCPQCPDGFRTEKPYKAEDGCNVYSCKCIPDSSIVPKKPCPLVSCPMGRVGKCKMIGGCKICKCLPICPRVPEFCPPECDKRMKNGCPYCHCKVRPPLCPLVGCLNYCPFGREKDWRGCNTCRCKSGCPKLVCDKNCKNGYQADHRGCPVCECKTDVVKCPPTVCKNNCKHGLKVDKFGCPLCQCKKKECSKTMCRMYCLFGFEKDSEGCVSCNCKRIPIEIKPYQVGAPGTAKG